MSLHTPISVPAVAGRKNMSTDMVLTHPDQLTGAQKAAIILQLAIAEGGSIVLEKLSPEAQKQLAHNFATIRHVDQSVLDAVIAEFEAELDRGGLPFAPDMTERLAALNDVISEDALIDLRDSFGISGDVDPWHEVSSIPQPTLKTIIETEGARIGAIILSKLNPATASSIVEKLSPELAHEITYAITETTEVPPETVKIIGMTIAQSQRSPKEGAFATDPVGRTAAILNAAGASTRDGLLDSYTTVDEAFATAVRAAIFTFEDIPSRIRVEDIPKITRVVANEDLVAALAYGQKNAEDSTKYILENMSKRMADQLRDEVKELGSITSKAGEAAQGQITAAIRELDDQGDISMLQEIDEQALEE